ncbi:hypothetical protein D3260_06365 [Salinisphaera sp. Q1T1-3]|nr:hypothetical protein D3260_06365 [Salinisphaera sp. Q1T1-3]
MSRLNAATPDLAAVGVHDAPSGIAPDTRSATIAALYGARPAQSRAAFGISIRLCADDDGVIAIIVTAGPP